MPKNTTNYFNLLFREMLATAPDLQPRKVDTPDHSTVSKCSKPERHLMDGPCEWESAKARRDRAKAIVCKRWELSLHSFAMYNRNDPGNSRRLAVPRHHRFFDDLKRKLKVDEKTYAGETSVTPSQPKP